ncbi:unnamed protein product [Eruca vesicaria subsp. sativa]|uniref:C2H2-type domain-containing protein n=1 Tax=Eruca vesicaria subsp. sativa TaxID=29727 RepID=A0ABC8KY30_ERUVS|nr:unnamed protein product [Eruca vesicaria subsp. sativa]
MSSDKVPKLLPFFSTKVYSGYSDTGKGFYKVYSDVFNNVYLHEVNFARKLGLEMEAPPDMGSLESPYAQVKEFYSHWLGFSTVMDFCWVDEHDVMAESDGWIRRKIKKENNKARKNAKRVYNENVRDLAAFVKKIDKRVEDMMAKRRVEVEVKEAEERERERERKEKMDKERLERLERAMKYKEPDWAKAKAGRFSVVEEDDGDDDDDGMVFYCIVCSKNFKSEKQWKNHEQSKKHKEIVAELRVVAPETVEQLYGKIQEGFNIDEEAEVEDVEEEEVVREADETDDEYVMTEENVKGSSESEDDDEEMSLLKKMVSEQKTKLKNVVSRKEDEVVVEKERTKQNAGDANIVELNTDDIVKDEAAPMEYDNRKSTGRRRRSKKGKDKNNRGELMEKISDADDTQDRNEDMEESHAVTFENPSEYIEHKKAPRSKKSTRGMKSKGTSKKASKNECGRCGEEFESRLVH